MVTTKERWTLSIEEAAERLGIGRSLAYDMATTGDLPTIRLGRRLLVPIRAVEKMLDRAGQRDDAD